MDTELLAILACPKCKGPITPVTENSGLECAACQVVYPVIDEIPVLLQEEAIPMPDWEAGKRSSLSPEKA